MKADTDADYPPSIERALRVLDPLVGAYKPFVDGLDDLPPDGRCLLVGNHTSSGSEGFLIPYFVHRQTARRVRPLADRRLGDLRGPVGHMMDAFGVVVGSPEAARDLMRNDETILVFPGGGREISKARDQLYTLLWQGRTGFARLAAEHGYPIVPASLVGGDDLHHILTSSDGRWARLMKPVGKRLTGRTDMPIQLVRGLGPTLIPRPQRMYLRFGDHIDTARPKRVGVDQWALTVRDRVKSVIEADLIALQTIRATDPYRQLAPWGRRSAVMPGHRTGYRTGSPVEVAT